MELIAQVDISGGAFAEKMVLDDGVGLADGSPIGLHGDIL